MLKNPRLRSHLRFIVLDPETVYIASELEERRLTGAVFRTVLSLCDGVRPLDLIVDQLSDRFDAAQVYYAVLKLEEYGVLEEGANPRASPVDVFYALAVLPDASEVPAGYPHRRGLPLRRGAREHVSPVARPVARPLQLKLFAAGEAGITDLADRLRRSPLLQVVAENDAEAFAPDLLTIVVTPDYLEPELEALNRRALAAKAPWLLVKPVGVIPWLGPLFLPGQTGCMECLLDRLRGHRWVESSHMAETNATTSLRRSCAATAHSLDVACGLLAVELEKLALGSSSTLAGQVLTVDLLGPSITEHALTRRPQCPACGKPGPGRSAETLPKDPLVMVRRPKSSHRDGGERIREAGATIASLENQISPVTGAVGFVQATQIGSGCFGHYYLCGFPSRKDVPLDLAKSRSSASGISMGKGRTEAQARASGIGEALERFSVEWRGDEPGICARVRELKEPFIHPQRLLGFSQNQYRDRVKWAEKNWTSYVPDPFDESVPIDWSPAWSLTDCCWKWVPTGCMYFNNVKIRGSGFFRGDTNGAAAGNCLEEAVAQGFYELVERDATGVWWYNRLRRPGLDLQSFDSAFVNDIARQMRAEDCELNALDLTHDLGIPVIAAISRRSKADARYTLIGLGAHSDARIALERAMTELGQSWRVNELNEMAEVFERSGLTSGDGLDYLAPDSGMAPRRYRDFRYEPTDDFLEDIKRWTALLRGAELEMLIADLTRPDIGLTVARVIVPGLGHFWPRFGCQRLYEIPVRMGWLDRPLEEAELNETPFLF